MEGNLLGHANNINFVITLILLLFVLQVSNPLQWNQRQDVLLGAAKGLGYLHLEDPPVVHHDINSYVVCSEVYQIQFVDGCKHPAR